MNRYDEIQAVARDIASNVHADPAARDAMADGLIRMVGLMVGAVGKAVAIKGEQQMKDVGDRVFELDTESIDYSDAEVAEAEAEFDADRSREVQQGSALYAAGERLQEAATELVKEATNPGVDLDRWRQPTPGDPCRCGHVPQVHEDGKPCNGEQFNGEACKGGPCNGFVRAEPTGGWVHVDRRPAALRDGWCNECSRFGSAGHLVGCSQRPASENGWVRKDRRTSGPVVAATDVAELVVGAVVYPVGSGVSLKSQGLVLGPWPGASNNRVAVWWVHQGPATADTITYENVGALFLAGTLADLTPSRLLALRGMVGPYDGAEALRAAMDAALAATPAAPTQLGNPDPGSAEGFGATADATADATGRDDRCCHGNGHCPWSRVKAGGCCYPKNTVCPDHH